MKVDVPDAEKLFSAWMMQTAIDREQISFSTLDEFLRKCWLDSWNTACDAMARIEQQRDGSTIHFSVSVAPIDDDPRYPPIREMEPEIVQAFADHLDHEIKKRWQGFAATNWGPCAPAVQDPGDEPTTFFD